MNRHKERFCLKWNDFQENAITAFGTLREDREFADVTLACEDGQQVEAHKVILASSSPFFLELLRRNQHPHPLIYMRGINPEVLVAIIDFLYCGEASIYHNNIEAFLALAEELNLKVLTGIANEKQVEEVSNDEHAQEKLESIIINEKKTMTPKEKQPKFQNTNTERKPNEAFPAYINQKLTETLTNKK